MYKNQLQELAQRSCFNLPSYMCIREGPDHAPRFKAAVNFNGESFESPSFCSTLRQAEHSAAEVALNALANRGPSNSLAARILDETGVYKNLLQEVSQRVGASLPAYTTFRTGLGHLPVFTGTVELAGVIFTGEPAKNKKQAEKNAAMAAWLSLKSLMQQTETPYEKAHKDEQEHVSVARALQKYIIKARLARLSFPINFPTLNTRPSSSSHHQSPATSSKILPLICPKTSYRNSPSFQRPVKTTQTQPVISAPHQKFPGAGAAAPPYIPVRHCNPHSRIAPPVTVRNMIPVFSAPPLPSPQAAPLVMRAPVSGIAPPVCVRHSVPAFAAPVRMEELRTGNLAAVKVEDPRISKFSTGNSAAVKVEDPRISKSSTGNLAAVKIEDPRVPKPSTENLAAVNVEDRTIEEPLCIKPLPVSLPSSEVFPTVQTEPTTASKVSAPPVASSQASSAEEALAEIEGLKDLKI